MMTDSAFNVAVIDDHPLFRRGVVELLNDHVDITVIAEYDNARSYLEDTPRAKADLLLLDLNMPEKSGIELLTEIRQSDEQLKIIILTACTDETQIFEVLRQGANGYLQKDTPPDEILSQLLSAMAGNVALNSESVTTLANYFRDHKLQELQHSNDIITHLTEREQETLALIAKGLNNKLIARELGITDGTVKVYVKSLLRKLNLHSRLELAAWSHQNVTDELLSKEV